MSQPEIEEIDPAGDVMIIVPADPVPTPSQQDPEATPDAPKAMFKVSSKHLTLASGYFHGRLARGWSEGRVLADDGATTLQMSNVDTAALTILLNIIHGKHRKVPSVVTFDELITLATLTDYLQCQEVVEPSGIRWTTALRTNPIYPAVPRDVVSCELKAWIVASLCFRDAIAFAQATQTAQRYGSEPFDSEGLPIPRAIIADIDSARENFLALMYRLLRRRAKHLSQGPVTCNQNCDAMYLGLLMRLDAELGSPIQTRKRRPYRGVGAVDLCGRLRRWAVEMQSSLGRTHGAMCANWHNPLGAEVTGEFNLVDLRGLSLPDLP